MNKLPEYVRECGKKYKMPNPQNSEPMTLTRTCNNFHLCSMCRGFRVDAHKEALSLLSQRGDAFILIAKNKDGHTALKKILSDLNEDQYKRYPLEGGLAILVLNEYRDQSFSTTELDSIAIENLTKTLVLTPKGKRLSGTLYNTNERRKKDDKQNTIPIRINAPQVVIKTKRQKNLALMAQIKTHLQISNWRPDRSDIEAHMQEFQNLLEKNYLDAGLVVEKRQLFRLRVDPEQIHWVGYDTIENAMSIEDPTIRIHLIDIIRSGAVNEIEKLPAPTEFGLIFSGWRAT